MISNTVPAEKENRNKVRECGKLYNIWYGILQISDLDGIANQNLENP